MPQPRAGGRAHPAYVLYRVGSALASAIPEPLLFPAAELAGRVVGRLNGRRRDVVRRNMRRAVGSRDLELRVDEAFRSYARYWAEVLRVPKPGLDELRRRMTSEGIDRVAREVESGHGVIFVTPHLGNWDLAGAWLASYGWRVVAVAEELKPPALYELFVRLRRTVGIEVYPLGRAASARGLLSGLREGAVLGLVADRDISGSGVEVEFFGERTSLPAGPAVLALRTGAPLAVGALYHRPGRRYHGVVLDPIPTGRSRGGTEEVRHLTQLVARDLETLILRAPGQWHLFQPNWPSDPGYTHLGAQAPSAEVT